MEVLSPWMVSCAFEMKQTRSVGSGCANQVFCVTFFLPVDSLFMATISTINLSDGDVIPWDSAPINPGGHFNTSIGGYVAPENGCYQ